MATVTLRWAAAEAAVSTTDYKIYSDEATSGTFVLVTTRDATNRGDGSYAPYATALTSEVAAGATSLTLDTATNFADGDYAFVENELFLLGGKSGSVFSACVGGQGETVKAKHLAGASVFKAHESYAATVSFGSRKVVRFRIAQLDAGVEAVPEEITALNPTLPPTSNLTTIYGIVDDAGTPVANLPVELIINQADNYHPSTGEQFLRRSRRVTTDADGYWEFVVARDRAHAGGDLYTITISPDDTTEKWVWTVRTVPDVDSVNVVECV